MKKRFWVFVVALLCSMSVYAQTEFYVELDATYSFLPNTELTRTSYLRSYNSDVNVAKFNISYDVQPGFNVGFGFSKTIKDGISFSSGIGLSYYQYKRKERLTSITSYNVVGNELIEVRDTLPRPDIGIDYPIYVEDPDKGKTKILYLTIPVHMQYSLIPEKLKIGLGFTNCFIAYSSQIEQQGYYALYKDKSSDGLKNYQLTGDLLLEYSIVKGFWIRMGYSHGFLSIYNPSEPVIFSYQYTENTKYKTLELGLKYIL